MAPYRLAHAFILVLGHDKENRSAGFLGHALGHRGAITGPSRAAKEGRGIQKFNNSNGVLPVALSPNLARLGLAVGGQKRKFR